MKGLKKYVKAKTTCSLNKRISIKSIEVYFYKKSFSNVLYKLFYHRIFNSIVKTQQVSQILAYLRGKPSLKVACLVTLFD